MPEQIGTIVFEPPGADAPGYLKRVKKALALGSVLKDKQNLQPEAVDEIVAFLLPYVQEPTDRAKAEELLWTASEAQFLQLMDLVAGKNGTGDEEGAENPTS